MKLDGPHQSFRYNIARGTLQDGASDFQRWIAPNSARAIVLELHGKTLGAVLRQAATSARRTVCFVADSKRTFVQPRAPHATGARVRQLGLFQSSIPETLIRQDDTSKPWQ